MKKGVAKAEIDRTNKILERHLSNTSNICTVIDAVYVLGQTIEERKDWRGMKKKKEIKLGRIKYEDTKSWKAY